MKIKIAGLIVIATVLSGCAANDQYPSGSLGQEVTDAYLEGFIPGTPTLKNIAREAGRQANP